MSPDDNGLPDTASGTSTLEAARAHARRQAEAAVQRAANRPAAALPDGVEGAPGRAARMD